MFLIIPCGLAVYAARSNNAEAFDVIMMVIGSLVAVGSAISFAAVKSKSLAVFRQINDMIETSKSKRDNATGLISVLFTNTAYLIGGEGASIVIFQEVEERCQLIVKRMLATLLGFGVGFILAGLLLNIAIDWKQGVKEWVLPFKAV